MVAEDLSFDTVVPPDVSRLISQLFLCQVVSQINPFVMANGGSQRELVNKQSDYRISCST